MLRMFFARLLKRIVRSLISYENKIAHVIYESLEIFVFLMLTLLSLNVVVCEEHDKFIDAFPPHF